MLAARYNHGRLAFVLPPRLCRRNVKPGQDFHITRDTGIVVHKNWTGLHSITVGLRITGWCPIKQTRTGFPHSWGYLFSVSQNLDWTSLHCCKYCIRITWWCPIKPGLDSHNSRQNRTASHKTRTGLLRIYKLHR